MSRPDPEGWWLTCPECGEGSFTPGQSAPRECPLCWAVLTPEAVQDAELREEVLSMYGPAPRAGKPRTAHSAQKRPRKTWDEHQAEEACGGVGAALTAAFAPLAVWTLQRIVRALARLQRALR